MNKKGFTLIELLAVIIILGILMIIAIPSVTKYISDSRKSAYVDTAKQIIGGARNLVNDGKLEMYDTDITYYIESSCIKTENESKSPYGEFTKAYVVVTYDGKGYDYYWTSVDDAGQGIKDIVRIDKLDTDNIESDLKETDISTLRGIDGRSKTVVVSKQNNCQKEGANQSQIPVSGETGREIIPVCKRAETLHTDTCNKTSWGCNYAGYSSNGIHGTKTITYGNLGTSGNLPVAGDAFDCDVNGDGIHDSDTERFYYIGQEGNKYNFIYFSNISNDGTNITPSMETKYKYASIEDGQAMGGCHNNGCNWYGPITAVKYLPTKDQWSNLDLIGSRTILNQLGTTEVHNPFLNNDYKQIINPFDYGDKVARMLTRKEAEEICGLGERVEGELDSCNYLLEKVPQYINDGNNLSFGYWLETASDAYTGATHVSGGDRYIYGSETRNGNIGIRPVISISKSKVKY